MNPFLLLPSSNLESLLSGFSNGSLKYEVTTPALLNSGATPELAGAISSFIESKAYSPSTVAAIIGAVLDTREHIKNVALSQSLVVSGPDSPNLSNLKTGARFVQIVEHAKHELMLATFALYQGDKILEPIHQAMVNNPDLKVTLVLNIQRNYGDRTLSEELIAKARQDFVGRNWPWELKPHVYYFPESLHLDSKLRASMHAKFLIADEERCFITSANFTEAAQKKNIEIGVELQHSHEPKALSRYFKDLIARGELKPLLEPEPQAD